MSLLCIVWSDYRMPSKTRFGRSPRPHCSQQRQTMFLVSHCFEDNDQVAAECRLQTRGQFDLALQQSAAHECDGHAVFIVIEFR